MVPVSKNVGERSTAKIYRPVSLLSVVSKFFEKRLNTLIVDHLEKSDLFSDFQYGFRSSRSIADLMTVTFGLQGLLTGLGLNISKAFGRASHTGLLHKLNSYGISGKIFSLICSCLRNRRLLVVLDENSSQEYSNNVGVSKGSIFGPTLFLLNTNNLPDGVIYIIQSMLMILLSTLSVVRHLICDNN